MANALRRELESLPQDKSGKVTLYAVASPNSFREASFKGSTDPVDSFYLTVDAAMLANHGTEKIIKPLITSPSVVAGLMKEGKIHQSVMHYELKNSIRETQSEYGLVLPPAQMAEKIAQRFDDKMISTPYYVPFKNNGQTALIEILEQGKADPARIADTILSSNAAKQYQNKLKLVSRDSEAGRLVTAIMNFPEAYIQTNTGDPESLMDEATVELNDLWINGECLGDVKINYYYNNNFTSVEDSDFEHEVESITFGVLDDNDKVIQVTLTGDQAKLIEHLYVKNDGVEDDIATQIIKLSPELSEVAERFSQNEINEVHRERQANYQM
jgi:hypothetical protein